MILWLGLFGGIVFYIIGILFTLWFIDKLENLGLLAFWEALSRLPVIGVFLALTLILFWPFLLCIVLLSVFISIVIGLIALIFDPESKIDENSNRTGRGTLSP